MAKGQTKRKADHRTRVGAERSARTETRILRAAVQVYADKGPDAPTIDDFVREAGISRGTFYNYFKSTDELLAATSVWITGELIESIEAALEGLEGPALRLGVGLRLFFAAARSEPVWCRFVARVWKVGGVELPMRDVDEGVRQGVFRSENRLAAQDLVLGATREALLRIGTGTTAESYDAEMTRLILHALGARSRLVAAVVRHALPPLQGRST
jgi:AcrR family transcriptional regulator